MVFLSGITWLLFHLTCWAILLAILIPVSIFLWKMIEDLLNNNGEKTTEKINIIREKTVNSLAVKPSVPAEKLIIKKNSEVPYEVEEDRPLMQKTKELDADPVLNQPEESLPENIPTQENPPQKEKQEVVETEGEHLEEIQELIESVDVTVKSEEIPEVVEVSEERTTDRTEESKEEQENTESGIIFLDKEAPLIMEPVEEEKPVQEKAKEPIQRVE